MSLEFLFPGMAIGSALALGLWGLFRLVPRVSPDVRAWSWRLVLLKLAVSAFAVGQVTLALLPATPLRTLTASDPPSLPVHLRTSGSPTSPAKGRGGGLVALSSLESWSPGRTLNSPRFRSAPLPLGGMSAAGGVRPDSLRSLPFGGIVDSAYRTSPPKAPDPTGPYRRNLPEGRGYPGLGGIGVAWMVGVALLFVRALFVTERTRRELRGATPVTDVGIVGYLEAISKRAGLRRAPRLVWLERAQSPMVYGIWRPVIVLPQRMASSLSGDVELAVGHEIAHIRRGDLIWAAVGWLVRSVLFFNPVAWLADTELRASQESATDQEAVWITGASVAAYARMLLGSMHPDRGAQQATGLAMFGSFVSSQRRLRAMQEFSQRPRWTQKVMVAGLLVAGIGCLPTYTLVRAASAAPVRQKPAEEPKAPDGRSASKSPKAGHVRAHAHPKAASHLAEQVSKLGGRSSHTTAAKKKPDVKFVEESASAGAPPESAEFKAASKLAAEAFNTRVSALIAEQDLRLAEYRRGADQREREAEQRESEAQQRKREGEQRARAALLREQVIEENERDDYKIVGPGQRETDARIRRDDARQRDADRYQGVLDQRQRETDSWQRHFDENSVAAMRKETQTEIATARTQYQKRISELVASDATRRREAAGAAAYAQAQLKHKTSIELHKKT